MALARSLAARALQGAAALLLLGQLGCAAQRAAAAARDDSKPIVFANESTSQAEVWVMGYHLKSRRIGSVMAGATETLRVPGAFYETGTIGFTTRLLGSDGTAGPGAYDVRVSPDDSLQIRLPKDRRNLVVSR